MCYTIPKQRSTKAQVQAQVQTGKLSVGVNSEVHLFSILTLLLLKPIKRLQVAKQLAGHRH